MAKRDSNSRDNFLEIRSLKKALIIRGFELILLTVIVSVSYFYFPNLNLVAVVIVGTLAVILLSYFLFKETFNMTPENNNPETPINNESKKNEESWSWIKNIGSLIFIPTLISIIITATFHSLSAIDKGSDLYKKFYIYFNIEGVQFVVNITNIIISFIAVIFFLKLFKTSTFSFPIKKSERAKYQRLTDIEDEIKLDEKIEDNPKRVNSLVSQYVLFISLFAFSLVAVYSAIIISTSFKFSEEQKSKAAVLTIENNLKDLNILSSTVDKINTVKINDIDYEFDNKSKETLKTRALKVKEHRDITPFELLVNIINFSGALFIYLGFKVLHDQTLRADNVTYTTFWVYPVCFSILYLLIIGLFYLGYASSSVNATTFLNITDLIAGLANGLSMALLFGRYVSIEQSIKESKLADLKHTNPALTITYKNVFSTAIIFTLPVYALAQLLFGSLTIDSFGEPKMFQTMVYLFCLIGKIFFFTITYLLIRKKLLPLYLHGVVTKIGNYKDLEDCLEFDNKS